MPAVADAVSRYHMLGMTTLRPVQAYSRRGKMDSLDRRSAEFRFMRQVKAELVQHVGGSPNAVQRALIDRIAWLRLRINTLDAKQAKGGELTELDSRTYPAWVHSLSRVMKELGPPVATPEARPATLKDHLQRQAAGP